jgi:hypothetical protein
LPDLLIQALNGSLCSLFFSSLFYPSGSLINGLSCFY